MYLSADASHVPLSRYLLCTSQLLIYYLKILKWLEQRAQAGPLRGRHLPAPWPGAALGIHAAANGEGPCERKMLYAAGSSPGSASTSSRKASPRTSKLRYWSNEAQAGDSSTTGSATSDAAASRAASATARSSVAAMTWGTRPCSSAAKSVAASPIR